MANVDTSPTGSVGWRNLRTGLLFVGGLGLAAILGLIIGKNTSLLASHNTARLFISDIKGLSEGAMVAISGKKIGVVKSMDFAEQNDSTGVVVTLDIVNEHFRLVTQDSRATIKSLGVLGDKYIEISIGRQGPPLQEGEYIAVDAEPGFDDLTSSAIKTMNTIQDISAKINKGEGTIGRLISSNELNDKLMKAASNIESMSNAIMYGDGAVARMVNDRAIGGHLASLVTNLSEITASLKSGEGTLGKMIVDESAYNTLTSLFSMADSLFAQLNNRSGNIGKLTKDDALYRHLDHSILSLDSLLMDFKQNPDRYVKVSVF